MKKMKFNGLVVNVVLSASLLALASFTQAAQSEAPAVQATPPSSQINNTRVEHVYSNHPVDSNINSSDFIFKEPAIQNSTLPSVQKNKKLTKSAVAAAVNCGSWSTSGNNLLSTIKAGGLACIDSLFTSVPSGALTEANIITVANEAKYRGQIYNGVDSEEYLAALHYWIRAFYFQGNRELLTTANQAATKGAMDALFANSHFYDKTEAHAKMLDFAVPNVSGASIAQMYVTTVRNILQRYDQSFEDVGKWGSAVANITWNVLNECARLPACRATEHTSTLANELSSFIHNNIAWLDHPERDYHLHNVAYQLANMHSGKAEAHYTNLQSTLEARVNRIFTDFSYLKEGKGRKAYMLAMSAVNYNKVCEVYNLCTKKDDIIAAVLNDRITCPSGTLELWAQDMNQAQRDWTCSSLGAHETYFHSKMQTNNTPVVPDDNDKLRMVVFNDSTEWSVYGGALFGASTNNGGLYLEGDPSKAGDQATFFAYEDVPARPTFDIWNLRHEYIHYLDGRFNTQGDFGDVNANSTGKTVWYGEGVAEFISRKSCNPEAATAAAAATHDISTIFGNEYGVGQTRIYPWGYLAVRYMFEQQNATFTQMIAKFRQGDYASYKSTMVNTWINSKTYDNGFKAWLPSVTSSGCTVDNTRPPSPIEPLKLEDVQGTDQVGKNACFGGVTREDNELKPGVASCIKDATGNEFVSLGISVKSGIVADMQVTLRKGSGGNRMQHKFDGHPKDTDYDDQVDASGADQTILVKNVKAGWNYIRVIADPGFSNVTALVRYLPASGGSGNVAPTANANGPYSAAVNAGIAFSSNGSADSDGSIARYSWNFGDGSAASTSANPNHSYATAGSFTATLTVTDNSGAKASSSAAVTVSGGPTTGNYCAVNGGGTHEWIAGVAVGGLNSASVQDNYKLYDLTANLTTGANTITLTPGFKTGSYTEHWAVWIDYNKDGDFTDAGENVVSGLSGKTAVTGSITPPASAAGVTTRMRVAMKYNAAVIAPCTNISNGEVEDYTVTIAGTGPSNNAPVAATNGPFTGTAGTGIAMSSNGSSDSDGTITSRSWNFGDGTAVSTSTNPNHTYASAGTFTITLTVTDNDGATNSTTTTAIVTGGSNSAPTANANGPYSAAENAGIAFSSNGSSDSDGSIASYSWNFGDNSAASTSANPNHSYTAAGAYTVTLTVTDNQGATATSTAAITITGGPAIAYCTVTGAGTYEWIAGVAVGGINNTSTQDSYKDYTNLTANLVSGSNSITLTPGFSSGTYTEHWGVWIDYNLDGDFTDAGEQVVSGLSGKTAVTGSFTPPASAAGKTTRMRVGMKYNQAVTKPCTNIASGEFEDYTVKISGGGTSTPNKAPVAATSGPYTGTAGTGIAMNSNSSSDSDGTVASYSWNFGDGTSSTSANPNHTYAAAGVFTVTLTVTDNDNATNSTTTTATVAAVSTGGSIVNACSTQGPTSAQNLTNSGAICVPSSTSSTAAQYYYINVPAGTNSMTIKTAHGTGNGNLYYNAPTWATATAYTQNSTGSTNTESITVNNPAVGYRFISVVGVRASSTLLVELN